MTFGSFNNLWKINDQVLALWTGMPGVSKAGNWHVGWFGLTFVTRTGFTEWIVETLGACYPLLQIWLGNGPTRGRFAIQ